MGSTAHTDGRWFSAHRFTLILMMLVCAAIIALSCIYLFSAYTTLVSWYLGLNNCFYNSRNWSTDFFTPGIKSDGNMYCIIAIAVSLAGLFLIAKNFRNSSKKTPGFRIDLAWQDLLSVPILLIVAFLLWSKGNGTTLPAHDEIFSALNSAGIHPFQAISYYMLPNNHMLFNLLNGLLFHSSANKVVTGRLISLTAYCGLIVSVFYWFKHLFKNYWLAFLTIIAVALQCPVWGFSFQARGYELYLLAGWGMSISLFSYLQSPHRRWLLINVLCCCAGYFCMPSFLYLHAAQLLFMLLYVLFNKTREIMFWKSQGSALAITYLLYLPSLCFSGLTALAGNGYVAPMNGFRKKSLAAFVQWMWGTVQSYIGHIFSDIHLGGVSFDLLLYFVPLLLLFRRNNKLSRLFGAFYLAMWLVFFLLVIIMRRLPFERNLIVHYSITLTGVILVLEWLTTALSKNAKLQLPWSIILAILIAWFSFHFFTTNETFIKVTLYEHDVNQTYKELSEGLDYIPSGSTVAFSDESFFYRYVCMKNGCMISNCPSGNEMYYVKENYEQMPQALAEKYSLAKQLGDHAIYKKTAN